MKTEKKLFLTYTPLGGGYRGINTSSSYYITMIVEEPIAIVAKDFEEAAEKLEGGIIDLGIFDKNSDTRICVIPKKKFKMSEETNIAGDPVKVFRHKPTELVIEVYEDFEKFENEIPIVLKQFEIPTQKFTSI
jgi:hypothetical protein